VSLPHTGTDIPPGYEHDLVSPWLARKDADWWIERLYGFAGELGATVIRTTISRTVIDVNRDPSGVSLYPGQATTELCPTTTFDGEALYKAGAEPDAASIAERRAAYFDPYHAALRAEISRLRSHHDRVVVYDCHSIRSVIPRLFEGMLPHFNIGTNSGTACSPILSDAVEGICSSSAFSHVVNGRFKGGYITRSLGKPEQGATCTNRLVPSRKTNGLPLTMKPMPLPCARPSRPFSKPASPSPVPKPDGERIHDPHRQCPRDTRRPGHRAKSQKLADGSAPAHAHEQPRPRCGRAPG
jgi:formiminoglutamase